MQANDCGFIFQNAVSPRKENRSSISLSTGPNCSQFSRAKPRFDGATSCTQRTRAFFRPSNYQNTHTMQTANRLFAEVINTEPLGLTPRC